MSFGNLQEKINTVCPNYGLNSDGTIWFTPQATEQQKAYAQALMAQWQANPSAFVDYKEERRKLYEERGATLTDCVHAIMDHLAGDDAKLNEVQVIRAQVKSEVSK